MGYTDKIFNNVEQLKKAIRGWQHEGETIVFTNGVFDLLHLGHVAYIQEAKSLGQRLIVGINSDESVAKIKGPSRPINDEKSRMALIAAFESVDGVIIFQEKTPLSLISEILPDILVKGGDYTIDTIVGADVVLQNGGKVKQLNFIDGYSSTAIISKILNS